MPAATVVRDGWHADPEVPALAVPALVAPPVRISPAVTMRPWRAGDERLLARAADQISPASLQARFLGGVPRLPETYLRRLATLPWHAWGAQVALRADRCAEQVVGWAEFVRLGSDDEADLAILVLDAWQRRGIGRGLIGALVPAAVAAGVRVLHVDVDPINGAARGLLASVLGRDRLTARVVDGLLHYTVRLADL